MGTETRWRLHDDVQVLVDRIGQKDPCQLIDRRQLMEAFIGTERSRISQRVDGLIVNRKINLAMSVSVNVPNRIGSRDRSAGRAFITGQSLCWVTRLDILAAEKGERASFVS